jgi:hypothetical protein
MRGKRSHPEFTQTNVYLRKRTKEQVRLRLMTHRYEGDLGDLIEFLLTLWLDKEARRDAASASKPLPTHGT